MLLRETEIFINRRSGALPGPGGLVCLVTRLEPMQIPTITMVHEENLGNDANDAPNGIEGNGHGPISVTLPDLFISVMSPEAKVNPYYESIGIETDEWIRGFVPFFLAPRSSKLTRSRILRLSDKAYARHRLVNIPLLAAVFVPDGDEEGYRFQSHWLSWVSTLPTRSLHCISNLQKRFYTLTIVRAPII
jgi:hypothetical protein